MCDIQTRSYVWHRNSFICVAFLILNEESVMVHRRTRCRYDCVLSHVNECHMWMKNLWWYIDVHGVGMTASFHISMSVTCEWVSHVNECPMWMSVTWEWVLTTYRYTWNNSFIPQVKPLIHMWQSHKCSTAHMCSQRIDVNATTCETDYKFVKHILCLVWMCWSYTCEAHYTYDTFVSLVWMCWSTCEAHYTHDTCNMWGTLHILYM